MLIRVSRLFYRKIFSAKFRVSVRNTIKFIVYNFRYFKLNLMLLLGNEVNLILGAALTSQPNWISTNEQWFDISNKLHWYRLFKNKRRLRKALAEHVFEHLTKEEMTCTIKLIHNHLTKNGTLRIAVPDGNHPDKNYRKHTGINGIGADASDHKQFITYEFLKSELENAGFKCILREGYTNDGNLVTNSFSDELGFIIRSRQNKILNDQKGWDFIDSNSSLIIDAFK